MPVTVGQIVEGTVSSITSFGAFLEFPDGQTGMVHISEVADTYVKDINDYLNPNDKVKVKVISIDNSGKISLSIRKAKQQQMQFEENLAKFMRDSEEKLADIKRSQDSKRKRGYSRG